MALLNLEKSELLQELKTLKNELQEVRSKYELILESTGSHFLIFQNNKIIEFSPKSEELFVFASDFSEKSIEELMPIFQINGQPSKDIWYNKLQEAKKGNSKPFEFEFLDKAGNALLANTLLKLIDKNKFIANLELLEDLSN